MQCRADESRQRRREHRVTDHRTRTRDDRCIDDLGGHFGAEIGSDQGHFEVFDGGFGKFWRKADDAPDFVREFVLRFLEAFSKFGSDLDASTKTVLDKGYTQYISYHQ